MLGGMSESPYVDAAPVAARTFVVAVVAAPEGAKPEDAKRLCAEEELPVAAAPEDAAPEDAATEPRLFATEPRGVKSGCCAAWAAAAEPRGVKTGSSAPSPSRSFKTGCRAAWAYPWPHAPHAATS